MIKIGKIFPKNIFTILNRNVFNKFTKKFINNNRLINFKLLFRKYILALGIMNIKCLGLIII